MNFNLDRFWSTDDINLTTSIQVPQVFIRCNDAATAASAVCKVFENHRKCIIYNIANDIYIFSQTVVLVRSILKGQKLVENAKIGKFKCDILSNF